MIGCVLIERSAGSCGRGNVVWGDTGQGAIAVSGRGDRAERQSGRCHTQAPKVVSTRADSRGHETKRAGATQRVIRGSQTHETGV